MNLPNPKELDAILKLCRKRGVTDLRIGEIELKFGELPKEQEAEEQAIPSTPSDEDMIYWSAQPDPLAVRDSGTQ